MPLPPLWRLVGRPIKGPRRVFSSTWRGRWRLDLPLCGVRCVRTQIGAGNTFDLSDRVKGQIDHSMGLAYRFLVRSGHETERLPFLKIHMRSMAEDAELLGAAFERRKLRQELRLSQNLSGKASLGLIMGIHKIFHYNLLGFHIGALQLHKRRRDRRLVVLAKMA